MITEQRTWGHNWLARWITTPPARSRTALVVAMDTYGDPVVIMAHFDTETGWRSVCDSRPLVVSHWMMLPPLPDGVLPRWARIDKEAVNP